MNDTIRITGTETDRRVLIDALVQHLDHAQARYDPNFRPAPGKKDRNLSAIRLCGELLERLNSTTELDLETTDEHRRTMRQALQNFAKHLRFDDATVTSLDAEVADHLVMAIPFTSDTQPAPQSMAVRK